VRESARGSAADCATARPRGAVSSNALFGSSRGLRIGVVCLDAETLHGLRRERMPPFALVVLRTDARLEVTQGTPHNAAQDKSGKLGAEQQQALVPTMVIRVAQKGHGYGVTRVSMKYKVQFG
jgi:hypothetical protein